MRRFRPIAVDVPQMEIMPLVDVIFLLLTFFVFALALMVRADLLDVRLAALSAGSAAKQGAAISIAIAADGRLRVNGDDATFSSMVAQVQEIRARLPKAPIFLAADEGAPAGALLHTMDALVAAGIADFSLIGRPAGQSASPSAAPPK